MIFKIIKKVWNKTIITLQNDYKFTKLGQSKEKLLALRRLLLQNLIFFFLTHFIQQLSFYSFHDLHCPVSRHLRFQLADINKSIFSDYANK